MRAFLDQLAAEHGLHWQARGDAVILWKPLREAEAARLAAALEARREAHDVQAWREAAQEALASGELELRRDIVRTVADGDAGLAAAARQAALLIGGERVAGGFSDDGPAGEAMLAWMHADGAALADPRFWGLWIDVHPKDGVRHCLKLIDTALKSMAAPAPDGARRVAALALAAAARAASGGQLQEVAARLGRCADLDVAIEALCQLTRRKEPSALAACRLLAAGTIDHQRWTAVTVRQQNAKQALTVLRYRPSIQFMPGWWRADPRFGDHGVEEDISLCLFNPLYQEPAIDALVAIHDPEALDRLTQCVSAIDAAKDPFVMVKVNGGDAVKMRSSEQMRISGAQEQAMAWLAAAGVALDMTRLLHLVDDYECFDLAGPGAPDLLLRLVRAGTHLGADDQRRLDAALFKQAQSLGGMMEVGMPNRYLPWLAHFNGLDDPALIGLISADLAKTDYHRILAVGSGGGQYGFPIYQRLAQSLTTMRTRGALVPPCAARCRIGASSLRPVWATGTSRWGTRMTPTAPRSCWTPCAHAAPGAGTPSPRSPPRAIQQPWMSSPPRSRPSRNASACGA